MIGCLYAMKSFYKKMLDLFPPSEKLDEQTGQLVDQMLKNGIAPEVAADIAQVTVEQVQIRCESLPILPKEQQDIS